MEAKAVTFVESIAPHLMGRMAVRLVFKRWLSATGKEAKITVDRIKMVYTQRMREGEP
jgi:hypothetical protein